MARDTSGNDLDAVQVVVTSKIMVVPYLAANAVTAAMIAPTVAEPTLPDAFAADTACIGLITSDGAPQDSRDGDDPVEMHQPGYKIYPDADLSLEFTAAEDNDLILQMTQGSPDDTGVYHVRDIIQNTKWVAYQETVMRSGKTRRRAGVIQVTGNEPAQNSRGDVGGRDITATWTPDDLIDGADGGAYLESWYDPSAPTTTGA